nr:MAG TPA: hypothetical protein [Caudoviricetes sp.]
MRNFLRFFQKKRTSRILNVYIPGVETRTDNIG